MKIQSGKIRIAVTGPESTGKTTLAKQLSKHFGGLFIPEYAREYVEQLPGPYTYADVETIALKQIEQYHSSFHAAEKFIVFDTWLIITRIWFRWVYSREPEWLDERIKSCPIDLFLLCSPDLPWEPDAVRENGGENRLELYRQYRAELKHYNFNFVEISGAGNDRFNMAIKAIGEML